ncbi:hypothetical protein [Mesonia sp. K7]|uniref:hypothetical protein n=1 Tax=Mesonia sp. K7 TaxID=2218606 RepID=UPI000DA9933C|nr:hypothetical protein [Mesonia sp. K7]PZD79117.1 hypothetical protein DNG35_03670 [Mesonia sp. K7]
MENNQRNNEEIDLNDLFIVFKKIGNAIVNFFVRIAAFILRFAVILAVLIVIGVILGYFWQENTPKYVQTQSIIGADYEASPYIYKKIEEINYKFSNENENYQQKLGIEETGNLKLEIEPVLFFDEFTEEEETYLEFIDETASVNEKLKEDIWSNSLKTHKIILKHPQKIEIQKVYSLILEELRSNNFYRKLYEDQKQFLAQQIKSNENFIQSLDSLITNYGKNKATSTVVVNGANFDFNGLILRRSELQKKTSQLITRLNKNQDFVFVIDQGNTQAIKDNFLLKLNKIVITPVLLIIAFVLSIIIGRIFVKARQLK